VSWPQVTKLDTLAGLAIKHNISVSLMGRARLADAWGLCDALH
jgi:hypothetical protein